jgi:hypothetical protein
MISPEESAAIVAALSVAYRAEATEATYMIWHEQLQQLDLDLARAATALLIATHDGFMPTVARFREAYRSEQRRAAAQARSLPEPRPPRMEPSKLQEILSEARAHLTGRGSE